MRSAESVHSPPFLLAARHQGPYADDLVKGVLWEAVAEGRPHLGFVGEPMSSIRAAAARSGTVSKSHTMTVCSGIIRSGSSFKSGYKSASRALLAARSRFSARCTFTPY